MDAPVNTLGIRRVMFAVDDIATLSSRVTAPTEPSLLGEMQYEDTYRLAYIPRGPEGIIVAACRAVPRLRRARRITIQLAVNTAIARTVTQIQASRGPGRRALVDRSFPIRQPADQLLQAGVPAADSRQKKFC